jgi:hypothetical protein
VKDDASPNIAAGRQVASSFTWGSSRSVAWSLRIVEPQARRRPPKRPPPNPQS